jgi:hypothetical protein
MKQDILTYIIYPVLAVFAIVCLAKIADELEKLNKNK